MKYLLLLSFLFSACRLSEEPLDADSIISKATNAYGLNSLIGKQIDFDFRDKHYSLLRNENEYTYTRSFQDSLGYVKDILVNSSEFTRLVDGKELELDKEWSEKYANSVNSVLYFIQLPLTLKDLAVLKKYQGLASIKDKTYHQIEVRFQEADGGKDFEDVFLYWFNQETFVMEYFAYSYITDGGGVRFREAINERNVNGIVFQDYINYKPEEKATPLVQLKELFEKGKLIELSRIENEAISVK